MLRIISFVLLFLPLVSLSQKEVEPEPKKKHVCFFKKKAAKNSSDHAAEVSLLSTRELVINKKNDPLSKINGKTGYALKDLLFEYWNKTLKSRSDSAYQNIDIEKQNVNYLFDIVKLKDKTVIVSITLLVKNNFGKEYATLIFCMQDLKSTLQKATVNHKNKTISVWNYLHSSELPTKEVSSFKLKSKEYPCYFD